MHPFDIKAAFFAKHAQHVVLIHFPIALFIAGVVFDFLSQSTKRRALGEVAYYNLLGAALTVLPVLATGLLAWQFQLEGQKLKGVLLMHLVLGFTSMLLIWIAWVFMYAHDEKGKDYEYRGPLQSSALRWRQWACLLWGSRVTWADFLAA